MLPYICLIRHGTIFFGSRSETHSFTRFSDFSFSAQQQPQQNTNIHGSSAAWAPSCRLRYRLVRCWRRSCSWVPTPWCGWCCQVSLQQAVVDSVWPELAEGCGGNRWTVNNLFVPTKACLWLIPFHMIGGCRNVIAPIVWHGENKLMQVTGDLCSWRWS